MIRINGTGITSSKTVKIRPLWDGNIDLDRIKIIKSLK